MKGYEEMKKGMQSIFKVSLNIISSIKNNVSTVLLFDLLQVSVILYAFLFKPACSP